MRGKVRDTEETTLHLGGATDYLLPTYSLPIPTYLPNVASFYFSSSPAYIPMSSFSAAHKHLLSRAAVTWKIDGERN